MPRAARVMLERVPFHITHRGNQRRTVFDDDDDCQDYLAALSRYARKFEMKIWGHCLMDNHVHLIAVGQHIASIAQAIGNAHREYSRAQNRAKAVTGHLWANRFYSTVLDESHLWAAIRYVELNPVRAGLCRRAIDYRWSSARANAGLYESSILDAERPFPGPIGDWAAWLDIGLEDATLTRIRKNTQKGLPTGDDDFVADIEVRVGRSFRRSSRSLMVSPKRP